jgi:hypothetical protein
VGRGRRDTAVWTSGSAIVTAGVPPIKKDVLECEVFLIDEKMRREIEIDNKDKLGGVGLESSCLRRCASLGFD